MYFSRLFPNKLPIHLILPVCTNPANSKEFIVLIQPRADNMDMTEIRTATTLRIKDENSPL